MWDARRLGGEVEATLYTSMAPSVPTDVLSVAFGQSYLLTGGADGAANIYSRSGSPLWVLQGVRDEPLRAVGWRSVTICIYVYMYVWVYVYVCIYIYI